MPRLKQLLQYLIILAVFALVAFLPLERPRPGAPRNPHALQPAASPTQGAGR
jgi:hypothetical protein